CRESAWARRPLVRGRRKGCPEPARLPTEANSAASCESSSQGPRIDGVDRVSHKIGVARYFGERKQQGPPPCGNGPAKAEPGPFRKGGAAGEWNCRPSVPSVSQRWVVRLLGPR